jgi:putative IMPACT (imprinted ancient) family translation regulator
MIAIPYSLYEQVKRLARIQGEISEEDFGADVTMAITLAEDDVLTFEAALAELTAGKTEVLWLDD